MQKTIYKYFRPETQKFEDVEPELWQWEAIYTDNTNLKQFDDHFKFHQFREIDQSKLQIFKMFSPSFPQTFTLLFDSSWMKLIHLYRIARVVDTNELVGKMYIFGYESKIQGDQRKSFTVILPDNHIVVTPAIEGVNFG